MKNALLVAAALLVLTAVVLGALSAHWLKNQITSDRLEAFHVGVRYQMYHALALLFPTQALDMGALLEKLSVVLLLIGVLLFSGSPYLISTATLWRTELKFLGPITPPGGLLMVAEWAGILFTFAKNTLK